MDNKSVIVSLTRDDKCNPANEDAKKSTQRCSRVMVMMRRIKDEENSRICNGNYYFDVDYFFVDNPDSAE